jgi:hypothetical protein
MVFEVEALGASSMDELLQVHQRRVVYDPAYCSLLLDLGERAMPAIIWEPYTSLDDATEPSEKEPAEISTNTVPHGEDQIRVTAALR